MLPPWEVGRVMPFVLSVVLPGATDQPGVLLLPPWQCRVGFRAQTGQIPFEKVMSSTQPESARGCALPAADH